jgi:2-methylisocitrate lyase-like PEP mutase family enzyme
VDLPARAERLRSLHVAGSPLVLPNAWDAVSARIVEEAGFPAIATSSGAVARSLGFEDGGSIPPLEMFATVARIASAVSVPVTADIEDGYGLGAEEVVALLLEAGAVGCNLEDSDHRGPDALVSAERQAERIALVKQAGRASGVDVVVNARVDVHLLGVGPEESRLEEALRRARAYAAAGADCIYPITVSDDETLSAFVAEAGAPVNVLARVGEPLERFRSLGVARISFGSGIGNAAAAYVRDLVAAIGDL